MERIAYSLNDGYLRWKDISGIFPPFYKGDNFYYFLFAFLSIKLLLERGLFEINSFFLE